MSHKDPCVNFFENVVDLGTLAALQAALNAGANIKGMQGSVVLSEHEVRGLVIDLPSINVASPLEQVERLLQQGATISKHGDKVVLRNDKVEGLSITVPFASK